MTTAADVLAWLGRTDVYVLDQWMRGRIRAPMRILDAGCGDGRNVEPFLRGGFDVHGIDASDDAVRAICARAAAVAPSLPATNFRVAAIEDLDPARDGTFDVVLCVAALHFARDRAHFDAMLGALWSVVRPGGFLLARLATSIGFEGRFLPLGGGRFRLGDGSDRFLADEATLRAATAALGGTLLDPLKTVNVDSLRAMTTWVVGRPAKEPGGPDAAP
jgi:SAM-dependent methyltransferase